MMRMKVDESTALRSNPWDPEQGMTSDAQDALSSVDADTAQESSGRVPQGVLIVAGGLVTLGAVATWLILGLGFVWPVIAIVVCIAAVAATEWQHRGISESLLAVKYPDRELSPDLPPLLQRR